MDTIIKTNKSLVVELLPKLGNYLLGISVICYISGFIITNLYLGSLGIVNLEIIRSRYILSGFLFFLFAGSIVYLIYGLLKTIQKYHGVAPWKAILRIIWYSIVNIVVIYIVIRVIMILAGSTKNPPIGLPQITPVNPWDEWLRIVPKTSIFPSLLIVGIIILLFLLIAAIFMLINPKIEGRDRQSRKQLFIEFFNGLWKKKFNFLLSLIGIYLFLYLWSLSNSALNFMTTNQVRGTSGPSPIQIFTFPMEEGWSRYFYSIVVIYVIIGLFLIIISIVQESTKPTGDGNPLSKFHGWIYLVSIAIILIVPAYTLGVYPNIPQQIGGGQLIRVEPYLSDFNLAQVFADPYANPYLIDRTASSSIFIIINKISPNNTILEIRNDLILSITYNP